jgi:hypothetical protein
MKTLTLLTMACLFTFATMQSHAQDLANLKTKKETKKEVKTERKALRNLEGPTISNRTINNFSFDFGDISNVVWKRTKNFDEATFTKDGQKLTAYYDYDSKLVGTTSEKTFAEVPVKGQKEIKARYKDYSIGPVIFFDDNVFNESDMLLWGSQFDDVDNYFVVLSKDANKLILRVDMEGNVSLFKKL